MRPVLERLANTLSEGSRLFLVPSMLMRVSSRPIWLCSISVALLEGLADHVLGRLDGILRGHIEVIGGGDARAGHRRVVEAACG